MMAGRRPFVGGNWKCNGGVDAIGKLVQGLNAAAGAVDARAEVVVAPPLLYVDGVRRALNPHFAVAAQNCHAAKGAFTGEIAAEHLADFGLRWVIVGHSERRHVFGETDAQLAKKTSAALAAGLSVIFCVGETEAEREAAQTEAVVARQMEALAAAVATQPQPQQCWRRVVVAYEPVWAIGTGKTATSAQAQEAHAFTRAWLAKAAGADVAAAVRILYGGSVTPANAEELARNPDVDGFLVGGASLDAAKFVPIINAAAKKPQH